MHISDPPHQRRNILADPKDPVNNDVKGKYPLETRTRGGVGRGGYPSRPANSSIQPIKLIPSWIKTTTVFSDSLLSQAQLTQSTGKYLGYNNCLMFKKRSVIAALYSYLWLIHYLMLIMRTNNGNHKCVNRVFGWACI